ncbi:GNAT family N-acetyltransferase [Halieaceae bacterium IMCC14734]|uniref:GNAT family N-acetyltransferase n=1 Tax=Candidatus Litorirhabdus singularis TaxID=2518993 RepID=A0ABT3TKW3_9GAMM|nr:GNAT family N-acetyltransferase [Candidatus Litorirhabdus singularis]MCX2982938.1 GNAT family N-acetyltransferase [Candidatus Litorirhabdus singularis]
MQSTAVQLDALKLRQGVGADLQTINALIASAIGTWQVTERVQRQSLRVHVYDEVDLLHLDTVVAVAAPAGLEQLSSGEQIVGVATLEPAAAAEVPAQQRGLLLHGLYVHKDYHGLGVGSALLACAADKARQGGYAGVLVKAAADSIRFFGHKGLQAVPVADPQRDYPHRFWLALHG